jgi:hypothetical protein
VGIVSAASYFKDETGVHLSLHMTGAQYIGLMDALLDAPLRSEAHELRELLLAAHAREDRKAAGPGGERDIMARFDDVPPLDAPLLGGE